jgi:uncharacterized membrane protein YbhN (UPF0104 family)
MVGIGTSIPSSPGFIGTYEFFFTSSLAVIGIVGGTALSFAVVVHAVTFVSTTIIGMACVIFDGVSLRRDLADARAARAMTHFDAA